MVGTWTNAIRLAESSREGHQSSPGDLNIAKVRVFLFNSNRCRQFAFRTAFGFTSCHSAAIQIQIRAYPNPVPGASRNSQYDQLCRREHKKPKLTDWAHWRIWRRCGLLHTAFNPSRPRCTIWLQLQYPSKNLYNFDVWIQCLILRSWMILIWSRLVTVVVGS